MSIAHPSKNEVIAKIKKIFKLEYPKNFNVSKSLLFLKFIINHMLEIKTINGKILIRSPGIKILVKISGVNIPTFRFLKNSTSSNKFNITPKQ